MRPLMLSCVLYSLVIQAMAGEVAQQRRLPPHILQQQLVGRYLLNLEESIVADVANYHKNIAMPDFQKMTLEQLDESDANFMQALLKQLAGPVVMPKLEWKNNAYHMNVGKDKISFSLQDVMKNQLMINGRPFVIDGQRSMEQIHSDLNVFLSKKTTSFSLSLIAEAQASPVLIVIAVVLLLIAAMGVSYYLKSKTQKREALIAALRQADGEFRRQKQLCEEANERDEAYDSTFNLMSGILQERTDNTAAGAFYSGMLPKNGNAAVDCTQSVNLFIDRTLGLSVAAGDTSELGQLRIQLCGGNASARSVLYGNDGNAPGSYDLMRQCLENFHRTHVEITDQHRGSEWIDRGTGLIENRYYFNRAINR